MAKSKGQTAHPDSEPQAAVPQQEAQAAPQGNGGLIDPASAVSVAEAVRRAFPAPGRLDATRLPAGVRAKLNASAFMALRPDGEVMEAVVANSEAAGASFGLSSFARATVPMGGGAAFNLRDAEGDQSVKEISGVLVLVQPRGALWPSENPVEGTRPYLVTSDLLHARRLGDDPGDLNTEVIESCRLPDREGDGGVAWYDWQKLPYYQFGTSSRPGSRSKRCRENRLLGILRGGDCFPVLVSAPPTSIKNVVDFLYRLSPIPHYRAVVSVTLVPKSTASGNNVGRVTLRKTGELSAEEAALVRWQYTEPLKRLVASGSLSYDAAEFAGTEE